MNKTILGFTVIVLLTISGFSKVLAGGGVVSDVDKNTYKTVKIGTQEWMAENLRTTKYSNGTPIPNVADDNQWSNLSKGAWSYYDNDARIEGESNYGKLYNWYVVSDSRNICPTGWFVPTETDWTLLRDYLSANGHGGTEGTVLKSRSGWDNNGNGTDIYGWLGLPSGIRISNGDFKSIGSYGYYWGSSSRYLSSKDAFLHGGSAESNKRNGLSIRCLRKKLNNNKRTSLNKFDQTNKKNKGRIQRGNNNQGQKKSESLPKKSNKIGLVRDVEKNTYKTVKIGTQEWMAENLRTNKYSDGTLIPNVTDNSSWRNLTSGAWCYYNNDSKYESTYGKLYNWYAVKFQKLCPSGWHVPTDVEWTVLTDYLSANGHSGTEGIALKATSGWKDKRGETRNGTDTYGWLGLPGGNRASFGYFDAIGNGGYWWSSSQCSTGSAWYRFLSYSDGLVYSFNSYKEDGFSVRCLRD